MNVKYLTSSFTAVLLLFAGLADSLAQDVTRQVRIRDLDVDEVKSPQYQVSGMSKARRPAEWVQILCEYDTAPEWLDEAEFRFYVVLKNSENREPFTLLRTSISYVNIPKDNGHLSAVYLHPNTVERFGDVERVAVQVYIGGRLAVTESAPSSDARWWEELTPIDGLLLNRLQTPFAMINDSDYEAIKMDTAQ